MRGYYERWWFVSQLSLLSKRVLILSSAVIDGRTAFKIVNGHINVVGFAIEEELQYWGKMQLPNKTGVIQKVQDMESEKIGMNVEFLENRYTGGSITSTT